MTMIKLRVCSSGHFFVNGMYVGAADRLEEDPNQPGLYYDVLAVDVPSFPFRLTWWGGKAISVNDRYDCDSPYLKHFIVEETPDHVYTIGVAGRDPVLNRLRCDMPISYPPHCAVSNPRVKDVAPKLIVPALGDTFPPTVPKDRRALPFIALVGGVALATGAVAYFTRGSR